jgi:hypothetical protein
MSAKSGLKRRPLPLLRACAFGNARHCSAAPKSLIEHRSSFEGAGSPRPTDLLRFSVGLEAT